MLLDFNQIYKKYNLDIYGVIAVGAYMGDEYNLYSHLGIKNICWIEANPLFCELIRHRCPKDIVINAVVSNKNKQAAKFNITNNYSSSSLLELGEHKTLHPEVFVSETIDCETRTLDSLLKENVVNFADFNFLNIDTQGSELMVLEGAEETIKNIDYIYLEVNVKEVYKNCPHLIDIDQFLSKFNFNRVETGIFANAYGDAFYIKGTKCQ